MRKIGLAVAFILSLNSALILHAAPTSSKGEAVRQADPAAKSAQEEADKIIQTSDCRSCHNIDRKLVGPAYRDIAKKYSGQADAVDKLTHSVRAGGSGNWGQVPMTAHPNLKDADLAKVVTWILSLKDAPASTAASGTGKEYTYTLKDGKTVKLDFPLFVEGSTEKVTANVFHGYELFNSYCFRCHGQDATESELAPDLKRSLNAGMTPEDFFSTIMAGRDSKGMPAWAGFLSEEEVRNIVMYVRGRALDLIPVGRPPSDLE